MNRIWRPYQNKIDLYLLLGFLGLGIITIAFKPHYSFILLGLLLLTIAPIFWYLFLWLWVKHVLIKRTKKRIELTQIPTKCLGCYWYYGKIDLKYLSLCRISPYPKHKCLDFQYK